MSPELAQLAPKEKLEILRDLDHFRYWTCIDEKRFCLECHRLFSGREVQVIRDILDPDQLKLSCPSANCRSIPMDWVLPTEKLMAVLAGRL